MASRMASSEERLVEFCGVDAADAFDGQLVSVGVVVLEVFHLEAEGTGEERIGVEGLAHGGVDFVAHLFAGEFFLGLFLEVADEEESLLLAAVVGRDAVVHVDGIGLDIVAVAFAQLVLLAVDFLLAGDDGEVHDGGQGFVVDIDLGPERIFVSEGEIVGVVEIDFGFPFHGHGLEDVLHVVVLEVLVNLFVDDTVDFHHEDVFAVHFLDDAHGGVSFAEAGDGHFATLFL